MKRRCIEQGCVELTQRTRCTLHQRVRDRNRNANPTRKAYQDPEYRSIPLVGVCIDCGSSDDLTRDHITPISKGGSNDASNIVIRCRSCNSKKYNKETDNASR
jgi:5-methylcytosine-specific restriction endonuclease McrA